VCDVLEVENVERARRLIEPVAIFAGIESRRELSRRRMVAL
jgi:hypothetical protein